MEIIFVFVLFSFVAIAHFIWSFILCLSWSRRRCCCYYFLFSLFLLVATALSICLPFYHAFTQAHLTKRSSHIVPAFGETAMTKQAKNWYIVTMCLLKSFLSCSLSRSFQTKNHSNLFWSDLFLIGCVHNMSGALYVVDVLIAYRIVFFFCRKFSFACQIGCIFPADVWTFRSVVCTSVFLCLIISRMKCAVRCFKRLVQAKWKKKKIETKIERIFKQLFHSKQKSYALRERT